MNVDEILSNMKDMNMNNIENDDNFKDFLNSLNNTNNNLIKLIDTDNSEEFKNKMIDLKKNNTIIDYNTIKINIEHNEIPLLTYAIMKNKIDISLSIIESGLFDINIKDPYGNTPLIYSIQNAKNNQISLRLINDPRIDINCVETFTGMNSLMLSILTKNEIIAKTIITNNNLNINYCDNDKENILFKCLFADNYQLFDYILNLNIININHQQINGDTLLHELFIYKKSRNNKFYERLIKEETIDISIKNKKNLTAYDIESYINKKNDSTK